jgi:2-hydroxychromene-2-carboxylate isomerase
VPAPIDFYFDLSSPYGFLGAQKIGPVAARHGREVSWHPVLLGVLFNHTGTGPLTQIPLKGEYSKRDFARSARFHGLPAFRMPTRFPIPTQVPARLLVWLTRTAPERVAPAALALFRAYFEQDIDISLPEHAVAAVTPLGVDAQAARAAIEDPAVKDALKNAMEEAIARGVFGSPFFIVDGEPFWGVDRIPMLEEWVRKGGW